MNLKACSVAILIFISTTATAENFERNNAEYQRLKLKYLTTKLHVLRVYDKLNLSSLRSQLECLKQIQSGRPLRQFIPKKGLSDEGSPVHVEVASCGDWYKAQVDTINFALDYTRKLMSLAHPDQLGSLADSETLDGDTRFQFSSNPNFNLMIDSPALAPSLPLNSQEAQVIKQLYDQQSREICRKYPKVLEQSQQLTTLAKIRQAQKENIDFCDQIFLRRSNRLLGQSELYLWLDMHKQTYWQYSRGARDLLRRKNKKTAFHWATQNPAILFLPSNFSTHPRQLNLMEETWKRILGYAKERSEWLNGVLETSKRLPAQNAPLDFLVNSVALANLGDEEVFTILKKSEKLSEQQLTYIMDDIQSQAIRNDNVSTSVLWGTQLFAGLLCFNPVSGTAFRISSVVVKNLVRACAVTMGVPLNVGFFMYSLQEHSLMLRRFLSQAEYEYQIEKYENIDENNSQAFLSLVLIPVGYMVGLAN